MFCPFERKDHFPSCRSCCAAVSQKPSRTCVGVSSMFSGFEHCSLRLYLVPLYTEANVENSQVTPWLNIPAFFEQQVLLETFLQRSHQMRQVLVEQHCSAHSQVRFCRLHFEGLWLCKMCIGQQRGFAVFSHLICFRLLQLFNPKCARSNLQMAPQLSLQNVSW